MALKCDKRFEISAIFGRQKSLQNVGTSWPVQYSGLHFAGVRSTFGRFQHIFQKILNIHDLVVGH